MNLELTGEVAQSFIAVSRALTKFSQQNAASLGLTLPQMGILNTIAASAGITPKEITERLQMPKSSVSISVDDLVNLGLVDRKASEDYRREINLKATERGEELARKSRGNSSSYVAMQAALGKTAEEDIQSLLRIHRELLFRLEEIDRAGVLHAEEL